MKKTIILSLFVCLGMSLNTFAQSDNAALVITKADDVTFGLGFTDGGVFTDAWFGPGHSVITKSGQRSFNWIGTLDPTFGTEGDGLDNNRPLKFQGLVFFFAGVPYEMDCKLTPSQNFICSGKEVN